MQGECLNSLTTSPPFFWDHPREPVPEENFWTLWCKGRLTETIRLVAIPSGLTSAHLHHPDINIIVAFMWQTTVRGTFCQEVFCGNSAAH